MARRGSTALGRGELNEVLTLRQAAWRFALPRRRLLQAAQQGRLGAHTDRRGGRWRWLVESQQLERLVQAFPPASALERPPDRPAPRQGLRPYVRFSQCIPGWTRGVEATALARASRALPAEAVVVEIGSFLGCSTILLAGGRKLAGSGKVHCVDPFDASGDAFSTPVYRTIQGALDTSLRQRFEAHLEWARLREWVEVHQGVGAEVARRWRTPVDLLFLDGDQSYEGVRRTYDAWWPFLRPGGVIAVHNSANRNYAPDHDGGRRLVQERLTPPHYGDLACIGTTTFAHKQAGAGAHGP